MRTLRRKRNLEISQIPEWRSRVAQRAYQIFQRRGCDHGRDMDDWIRAEKEILCEQLDAELV
jgi:hypothetical protein